jgi:hypothetical protein
VVKEGDSCCTNVFHEMANFNRRKNSIGSLIDDTTSTNQLELNEHIIKFYKRLYTEQFN